jgi:hypothetical protein
MKEWTHEIVIAVKEKIHIGLLDYVIVYICSRKLLRAITTNARTTGFILKNLHENFKTRLTIFFYSFWYTNHI